MLMIRRCRRLQGALKSVVTASGTASAAASPDALATCIASRQASVAAACGAAARCEFSTFDSSATASAHLCARQTTAGCTEATPLVPFGSRGAKGKTGFANAKREKKVSPPTTPPPQHGRHATATPEGSDIMDFSDEKRKMEGAVSHLKQELGGMRSGRASPGMLDHIKAEAYGEKMPLNNLATILARDAQLLVATVYDPSTLQAVEKAIQASPLGLNPRIEGQEVLIPVPRPSHETQAAMAKLCKQEVEAAKVRGARKASLAAIKTLASEDERYRAEGEIQRMTDSYIATVEKLGAEKAQEIATI